MRHAAGLKGWGGTGRNSRTPICLAVAWQRRSFAALRMTGLRMTGLRMTRVAQSDKRTLRVTDLRSQARAQDVRTAGDDERGHQDCENQAARVRTGHWGARGKTVLNELIERHTKSLWA